MKFRKKPVVIDAWQWRGDNHSLQELTKAGVPFLEEPDGETISIDTYEGVMFGRIDDWIIKGIKGEYYPCKPDIFEATHEPVE